jgi:hypothetical protein
MVADIIERPIKKQYRIPQETWDRVHADALIIGVRPAARKHQLNEDTVCVRAHREKWKLPASLPTLPYRRRAINAQEARESTSHALDQLASVIDEQGEHSRLYLSAATLQASHTLAAQGGKTEGERVPYAGLLNVSRSGDTVHGWQAQRTAGPTVQIANVIQPTPEERAERQAMFAKLEEITRRLAAPEA